MNSDMERVLRPKEQARRSYNFLSRWYDLFTGSEKRITKTGIRLLDLQPSESILEIGCGTGHELVEFAKKLQGGGIIAVDISEEMIKVARKRFQKKTGERSVGFCQADGVFLPIANGRVDAVFLSFTLELFDTPELPQILDECRRILKPEGRIGVVSLAKQDNNVVHLYERVHRLLPRLVDCRPIPTEMVLRRAGFTIQTSRTKTMWGLPVDILIGKK